jgi:hypothetical protein
MNVTGVRVEACEISGHGQRSHGGRQSFRCRFVYFIRDNLYKLYEAVSE